MGISICAAAAFADGYDVQALGLAIPIIARERGIDPSSLTLAASSSLIGMALGAMLLAPLGDRYRRETVFALMLVSIGFTTAGAALSTGIWDLAIWRFLSGLGLGSVVPVAIVLTAACAPASRRAALVTLMISFTGIGAFAAGLLAPMLAELGGWRAIFAVGAVIPLITAALAWVALVRPNRSSSDEAAGTKPVDAIKSSVKVLFQPPLCRLTILVWAVFWLNLMTNYSLISWLPTLLIRAGWAIGDASRATGLISLGGICGALGIAMLTDKGRPGKTLIAAYVTAAIALSAFAFLPARPLIWGPLLLILGLTAFGVQIAMSAVIAARYPRAIQSTAIGWSSGFGRIGAFVGPVALGMMLSLGVQSDMILQALAIPMLICAVCIALMPRQEPSETEAA